MTRVDVLERLLAVTPEAPAPAAFEDADQLVRAALAVIEARAAVLADADVQRADPGADRTDPARLAELERRGAAWALVLAAHRERVGAMRTASSRTRSAYRQNPRR